ncbi:MAG: DUF5615 family PIN-like protein [Tepidisphaeraceae bacterium]
MKVLLDENLPHKLRLEISGHEVFTSTFMGWSGIENGQLLAIAAKHDFDAVLTTDRGMEYEQNTGDLPLSVVIITAPSNAIEDIRPLLPELLAALAILQPRSLVKI